MRMEGDTSTPTVAPLLIRRDSIGAFFQSGRLTVTQRPRLSEAPPREPEKVHARWPYGEFNVRRRGREHGPVLTRLHPALTSGFNSRSDTRKSRLWDDEFEAAPLRTKALRATRHNDGV